MALEVPMGTAGVLFERGLHAKDEVFVGTNPLDGSCDSAIVQVLGNGDSVFNHVCVPCWQSMMHSQGHPNLSSVANEFCRPLHLHEDCMQGRSAKASD